MTGHPGIEPVAPLSAAWRLPVSIAPAPATDAEAYEALRVLGDYCDLPRVDGEGFLHGLSAGEETRVRAAMTRTRDAYLSDSSADHRQTLAVVVAAGRDALRQVLSDRPAARVPAPAPAACCAADEPAPCEGCTARAPWFKEFDRFADDEPGLPPDPFADDDNAGLLDVEAFAPEPDEPRLTFATFLKVQASYFRSQGGTAALWLARKIDDLADDARRLSAACGEDLDARLEVIERDLHDTIRTDALADGYDRAMGDLGTPWRGE